MRKPPDLALVLIGLLAACGPSSGLPTSHDDALQRLGPACLERQKPDSILALYCGIRDGDDLLLDECENPCPTSTLRLRFDSAGRFLGVQTP